jgi:hypothetical protein
MLPRARVKKKRISRKNFINFMSFTEFWQAKKAAKAMKKRKTRSLTTEMRLAEPCRSKINKEIIFATRHDAIVVPIKLCRKLLARFDDFNDGKQLCRLFAFPQVHCYENFMRLEPDRSAALREENFQSIFYDVM